MSVCCECCVFSGRGFSYELITRPEDSYRLWCVVVCDLEKTNLVNEEGHGPLGGYRAKRKYKYTGLFISPSETSELDCATTKRDTAERSISIGRESLKVFFFVLGALAYLQVPPLGGSREEKWRAQ